MKSFGELEYVVGNGETKVKALEDIHLSEDGNVGPVKRGEFGQ